MQGITETMASEDNRVSEISMSSVKVTCTGGAQNSYLKGGTRRDDRGGWHHFQVEGV